MYDQYENNELRPERKQKGGYVGDMEAKPANLSPVAQTPQNTNTDPNGLLKVLSQRINSAPPASQPGGFLQPGAMGQRIDNGSVGMPMDSGMSTTQPATPLPWGLPGGVVGGGLGRGMLGGMSAGIMDPDSFKGGFSYADGTPLPMQLSPPLEAQLSKLFRNRYDVHY